MSPHGTLAGLRVLVVDDDDDARALVQAIVEEVGGQTLITTGSSQRFWRWCESARIKN